MTSPFFAPTHGPIRGNAAAYNTIKARNVTLFGNMFTAYTTYLGSLLVSIGIIVIDAMFLSYENADMWQHTIAAFLLAMDILTPVSMAVDLYFCGFKAWPLTMLHGLGQLTGIVFTTVLLSNYAFNTSIAIEDRDRLAALALTSVILHAAFTTASMSVTLETIIKSI